MSNLKPEISSPEYYQKYMKLTGYNQVLQHGNRIDISGQGGWTRDLDHGRVYTYKSLEEEIGEAFINVEGVLNSVGSSWKDVHSVTSYHKKLGSNSKFVLEVMVKLLRQYIGERAPLWTCIGVEALADTEMNVEIVVVAYKN